MICGIDINFPKIQIGKSLLTALNFNCTIRSDYQFAISLLYGQIHVIVLQYLCVYCQVIHVN